MTVGRLGSCRLQHTSQGGNEDSLPWAQKYFQMGINVVPIRTDGSKAPAIDGWKQLQERRNTTEEIQAFSKSGFGLAAIGGAISGYLEDIDFDDIDAFKAWKVLIVESLGQDFWDRLLIVRTPRPGFAVIIRCPSGIEKSQKLAFALNPKSGETGEQNYICLIETKSEGGYFLLPGCPPGCHKSGRAYEVIQGSFQDIPAITAEQRTAMLSCSRSLCQIPRNEFRESSTRSNGDDLSLPGNDFNAHGPSWGELLEPHGFRFHSQCGETTYWTRPGKDWGRSASTNHGGYDCFYPFSTNLPFDINRGYRKFAVYTFLKHSGNFTSAARDLAVQGFGIKSQQAPPKIEEPNAGQQKDDALILAAAVALAQVMHSPTEDNVALLFEERFGDVLRYCKTWGCWLCWDGSRWGFDSTDRAFDYCRGLARTVNAKCKASIGKRSFASGVESFARAARRFATEPEQWDRNAFLLNTPDGVQELEDSHETA
jgi:putative DNA primase/helicase